MNLVFMVMTYIYKTKELSFDLFDLVSNTRQFSGFTTTYSLYPLGFFFPSLYVFGWIGLRRKSIRSHVYRQRLIT